MICKDSERSIQRAIVSTLDSVDEFIIVDTGSTDRTIEIIQGLAEQHDKIKLHHFAWTGDFAAARNYSLSLVTHDWVFVMDSDDELPESERKKLRLYCEHYEKQGVRAGMYIVCDNTVNGEITSSIDAIMRLFPSDLRYKDKIHEVVDTDGKDVVIVKSDIHILHDGYDPAVTDVYAKKQRNLEMMIEALKEDQTNARMWMQLGREFIRIDDDKARQFLDRAESLTQDKGLLRWIEDSRNSIK
ncbi:glycosyltransferase [Paenibacillus tarimensis]|uniref:glycosyltransferase n=1 Tax=Paenibacillus tarimensis TaxID=416012 RepID=UPI001F34DAB7|nr:glycosyltransferase [Paenibacillus tarimensis]MCF2944108.1 glycosyltransferase [Paenibacillus tarimensis]